MCYAIIIILLIISFTIIEYLTHRRKRRYKKDYENKKLYNFRSKKLKRKYLQIFHGKKIYIGNYSDRTRADISYCHSASVDL